MWHQFCFSVLMLWLDYLCQVSSQNIFFAITPESRAVLLEQDFRLDCTAFHSTNAELTYQWEFNGESITESAIAEKAEVFTNNSLLITSADQSVLGRYRCVVATTENPSSAEKSSEASIVKAYIDSFLIGPQSVNVTEGDHVRLSCTTGYSAPPAVIHWEKDGDRVTDATEEAYFGTVADGKAKQKSSTLEFVARPEKAGSYICVARNTLLNQLVNSEPGEVIVQALPRTPEITSASPQNLIASEAQPFALNCTVTGYPSPQVVWYKENTRVSTTAFQYVMPNGSLHFEVLPRNATGSYRCEATNSLGQAVSPIINLTVAYLDFNFADRPRDTYVMTGNYVTLTCVPPPSVPAATVLWYKDDGSNSPSIFSPRDGPFPVRQTTQGDLYFANVQFEDSGRYFCVAHNNKAVPSSRTSPTASLMVEGVPVLVEPPVPQEVIKGQLLRLKCFVRAIPPARVAWYSSGGRLLEGDRISIRNESQELFVSAINKADEGDYWCVANNSVGSKESNHVSVRVQVPPEFLQSVPSVTTVVLGSEALIRCEVYGDPTPTVVWYKETELLRSGGRFESTPDGLKIVSVTLTDESTYSCEASNSAGTRTSSGRLAINTPPRISSLTSTEDVTLGESLVIRCDAVGTPDPTITWKFNGSDTVPSGFLMSDQGRRLTANSAAAHQTGVYRCVASNSAGVDEEDISVAVNVPPVVREIRGGKTINQGGTLELTCDVSGVPMPDVTWLKDRLRVTPTLDSRVSFPSARSLRILFMNRDDAARYACRAQSAAGTDTKSVDVRVREVPLAPTLTHATAVSMTSVNLTWEQPGSAPISFFTIQFKLRIEDSYRTYRDDISGSSRSHEVDSLRPFTDYVFRVAAQNDLGLGKFSNILGARTLETAPSPPRNLKEIYVNATTVQLQWEVPAQTNGNLRTYQLQFKRKNTDEDFFEVNIDFPSPSRQIHTVTGLQPYTTYEFKVRAATIENGITMWGEFSVPFTITTAANVPGQPPSEVHIRSISAHVIQVSWQSIPEDQENGPLRGYKVLYKRSQSTDSQREVVANLHATTANITNLKPWTYYDISVVAYNDIGNSETSPSKSVRTLAAAPTGFPKFLRISQVSNTSALVVWEAVEESERNSDISGYILQISSGQNTDSKYVNSPSTVQIRINDLKPYTEYTVQIQAFTTLVANGGFGMLSPPVTFKTSEGVPGAIANVSLSVTADSNSITLSWSPPSIPNGRIVKYIVTISPPPRVSSVDNNDVAGNSKPDPGSRRKKRQSNLNSNSYQMETQDTSVTIGGLEPQTMYTLSVVAETSAGRGSEAAILSVETEALDSTTTGHPTSTTEVLIIPTTTPPASESSTEQVTTGADVVAKRDRVDDSELAGIIAGSVIGGLLIIVLIVVLCFCFCRRKQQHNASKNGIYYYSKEGGVIPPTTFARESIAEINANTLELQQNAINSGHEQGVPVIDVHTAPSDHTSASTGYGSQLPSEANTSALQVRLDLLRNGREPFTPAPNSNSHLKISRSGVGGNVVSYTPAGDESLHIPSLRYPHHQHSTGLDNPAYEPDKSVDEATFSRGYLMPTLSADQNAEVNLSTRRKNRMKRDTAAIIAAQRDRATSVFDDTEELINNDSVIVYDERTVL